MAEDAAAPALIRAWRWIWEPSERRLHVDACPRCGETVVVDPGRPEPSIRSFRPSLRTRIPERAAPDEGQLLAACAEHGWAPFNERSLRLHRRRPD